MSLVEMGMYLFAFLAGWVVGWVQTSEPLKRKIQYLQSAPMERVLQLEQLNRNLAEELKWSRAKVQAQESDLDRMQKKLSTGPMDLPQQNLSYWRFEGPKLQKRVLDLEMELETLRSQTLWKNQ